MLVSRLVLVLLSCCFEYVVSVLILPTFSWDPRNEIFQPGKLCGGNYAHITVEELSEMYFICPSSAFISSIQKTFTSRMNMHENMYMVTKSEFERCEIDGITRDTKLLLYCDSPKENHEIKYTRFHYSPWPIDVSFQPNKTYYFIATSNGTIDGLKNRKGGRCKTNNMRLAITICSKEQNCTKNEHLCKTPKELKKDPVPTTISMTTVTKTTESASETTENVMVVEPKVAAKRAANDDTSSSKGDGFGVVAAACLIGGLFLGLVLGFIAVLLTQKYAKRYKSSKNPKQAYIDGVMDPLDFQPKKDFRDANPMYRNSTEGKRLLSTTSDASSERYSAVPQIPRSTPPPGTIAV